MNREHPISYPAYLVLARSGELARRRERALSLLAQCSLCPRRCGVDRLEDERGVCGVGRNAVISGAHAHFGEEAVLVGDSGSGTIFFSGCNLKCIFCQNYEISHELAGTEVTGARLAALMLNMQELGCHNLNFVTPTHVVPQMLEALEGAIEGGLRLPIVYNTGGYDSIEVLRLLEGVVDIYMPDVKFMDVEAARRWAGAPDYPAVVRESIREMHRQVGDLELSADGVARRGLLVRHLVMPGMLADTERIVSFIAGEISRDTYVNVMAQYRPEYRSSEDPRLDRLLSHEEWREALRLARVAGLHRFDSH
jgi:putative pyruvate formate lyase activating enzyme